MGDLDETLPVRPDRHCRHAAAWPGRRCDRIYRCGNEYTNNAAQAKERGCKLVEGGNVTVVEGTRPAAAPSGGAAASSASKAAASPPNAPCVAATEQRARDADARAILQG